MNKLFKLMATRWLARTPFGMAVLGAGWLIGRRRRRRARQEAAVRQMSASRRLAMRSPLSRSR
ncbi:DUF6203 family protein [Planobispora siamensis]|uniref:Uncharacterized protein n=1 Tax=Planobispora siamensis TaxID=936338 RepID=A0A8J3WRP2_9ACTN|nr:DUF6203 family protein [Planobispora siamensis]GIH97081.1 hypothetical protein Psi01_77110 [Planobispora siamensis]